MKLSEGKGWTLSSVSAGHPEQASASSKKPNPQSPKPNIRIEKRAGKTVTVIAGLHTYGSDRLNAMAKELKAKFGAGGTVKDGVIEIQGDRVAAIKDWWMALKKVKSDGRESE
jgi:translation initiation factor 1